MDRWEAQQDGLTLVELLVVTAIVAVLAAITIPRYLAQRERAWAAAMVSTIDFVVIEVESAVAQSDRGYPGISQADLDTWLADVQGSATEPVRLEWVSAGASGFCVAATHSRLPGVDRTNDGYSGDDPVAIYQSDNGGLTPPDFTGSATCA